MWGRKQTFDKYSKHPTHYMSHTIYIFFPGTINNNSRSDLKHMSPFLEVFLQLSKNMSDSWVGWLYQTHQMSTRNQQSWVAWIAVKSFGAMLNFKKKVSGHHKTVTSKPSLSGLLKTQQEDLLDIRHVCNTTWRKTTWSFKKLRKTQNHQQMCYVQSQCSTPSCDYFKGIIRPNIIYSH